MDVQQDLKIIKPQDAIQESSTETVDVQEPARDREAVGERDATGPVTREDTAEVQVEETPITVREEAADLAAMLGEELQAPAPTTEAAPAVTEEVTTTPATEKQKAGYNKRINKGIKDANKATTTKEKAKALQTIITNTTAIQERHGESFVTDEQQAEIDRLTQELADEGAQISENVQKGKEVGEGQIIDIDKTTEDNTLPEGTTIIERVNTPELVDSEGNLVQRGNVDVRLGTRKLTQAEANAKIAEIEAQRENSLNTVSEQFHETINEEADAKIAEVRKNTEEATPEAAPAVIEAAPVAEETTVTEAAPAVTEEVAVTEKAPVAESRSAPGTLEVVKKDLKDSGYTFMGNSDLVKERRPTNDKGVKFDDNGPNTFANEFKKKFGVDSPTDGDARMLANKKAREAGVDADSGNIGKVVSEVVTVGGENSLQLAFNANEHQRRAGKAGGMMIKIPDNVNEKIFARINEAALQIAIDQNIKDASKNEFPVEYSIYDYMMNEGKIVSDMNKAKAEIIANMQSKTAPTTQVKKAKPTPAPKVEPKKKAPKAKAAPAPKVVPVAEGIDPFYDSVEAQQKQEERIGKLAEKARKAINKVLPNAKIILHKTEAEYNKATKANSKGSQGGAGSRGVLIDDTIHVNMPHANDRTIAHEVFHALLTNLNKENRVDVIELTKKMADNLQRNIKDKEILADLNRFVNQYSGEVEAIQAEEMVAEFMGILAERYNFLISQLRVLYRGSLKDLLI